MIRVKKIRGGLIRWLFGPPTVTLEMGGCTWTLTEGDEVEVIR
jgi:hypothetical protein